MKMILVVALMGWGLLIESVSADTEEEHVYQGSAHALLKVPSIKPWTWTVEQGIEIDDFLYPPYVPESNEQAARTNRLLMRVVERLGPVGVVSMAHHKLLCQDQEQEMDWGVKVMVFKSSQACLTFWESQVASHMQAESIKVDNLGDVCFKRQGQAITYLYLRRANVYVEAKGRQDHDILLLWMQALDQNVINPPKLEPSSNELTDPNMAS